MSKWTLIFDVDRCNGCCNCVLATMDEYVGNTHPGYAEEMPRHGSPWLAMRAVERGAHPFVDVAYLPVTCNHCDDAPCLQKFPDAITRRTDGIVIIDPARASGNRAIVDACPLGAIHWNEEKQVAQNWNLDAHLLDAGWKEPRAAQACPTGALKVLKLSDHELAAMKSAASLDQTSVAMALGSRLYFKGAHRLTATLVGGSAATTADDREEPLVGADVQLCVGGAVKARTCTDALGNFRFDLAGDMGDEIEIVLRHEEHVHRRTIKKARGVFKVGVLMVNPTTRASTDPLADRADSGARAVSGHALKEGT